MNTGVHVSFSLSVQVWKHCRWKNIQRRAHSVLELPRPKAETTDLGINHDPQWWLQYQCLAQHTLGLTCLDRDLRLSQVESPPHRQPFQDSPTVSVYNCQWSGIMWEGISVKCSRAFTIYKPLILVELTDRYSWRILKLELNYCQVFARSHRRHTR